MHGLWCSRELETILCSLISDGAAAVVLVPAYRAHRNSVRSVRVLSVAQTSDFVALDSKADITELPSVKSAGLQAYEMAGLGPQDIDFAEIHDCFTIAEIIATEDLGFTAKGDWRTLRGTGLHRLAWRVAGEHQRRLKSKGHPVGATGVAQICDVALQIRGDAGARQVKNNSIGLAQNLGGSGATCVVTILGAP